MTFEGFDAAPLIEGAGFSPILAGGATILVAAADGTLEAALHAARLGPRAAPDAHDLWADRGGDLFGRGGMGRHDWLGQDEADHAAPGAKDVLLRAALWDDVDGDGEEDEPITVTGRRNVSEGSDGDIGGNYGAGFYPGGTDGTGGPPTYVDNLANQCAIDNKVDYAAQQVANLIKAKSDWIEREYAAIIYMTTDGQIRMTSLVAGQTVAEAQAAGLIAPETHLTVPSDLGGGVILAVVHSHPDVGYDILGDLENLYPSDRVGSGDYYAFEQLAGHDPRFANNAAFAQYILGPDGQLREFNAKDGRINTFNDPDPASRTNLAKDRPCG